MGLVDKLEQIELEIADGKLGIARDRLHGLLNTYPRDLSLRAKLGEVYWKLGYPVEAGRFWYLETDRTEIMNLAIAKFDESCSGDPETILRKLKVRGVPREIYEAANEEHLRVVARARIDIEGIGPESAAVKKKLDYFAFGCCIALIIIGASLIHSFVALMRMIFGG